MFRKYINVASLEGSLPAPPKKKKKPKQKKKTSKGLTL